MQAVSLSRGEDAPNTSGRRLRVRRVGRVLAGLVVLLAIGVTVSVGRADYRLIDTQGFEETECPMMLPGDVNVTCGYLSVPEDHSDANSRTIKLAVAILHSHSEHPLPDPVVHLHGGPGQGDLSRTFGYLGSSFLAERDLILVDQRGVGFSEPALRCPELDTATVNSLIQGSSREDLIAGDVAGATACRDRLQSEGITLEAYNTLQSAADLESLRLRLGYRPMESLRNFVWHIARTDHDASLPGDHSQRHPGSDHALAADRRGNRYVWAGIR